MRYDLLTGTHAEDDFSNSDTGISTAQMLLLAVSLALLTVGVLAAAVQGRHGWSDLCFLAGVVGAVLVWAKAGQR